MWMEVKLGRRRRFGDEAQRKNSLWRAAVAPTLSLSSCDIDERSRAQQEHSSLYLGFHPL